MNCNCLISIVLPTYNGGGAYLDQAVGGCLAQAGVDLELIIVDDASTDDTPRRVGEYATADTRVVLARHEVNRGLPAALNTGFALARGAYLTWTSDDNCYRPGALAEMAAFLACRPDVGFVYSDYSVIDEAGRLVRHVAVEPPEALASGNVIGPSFVYRRAVMDMLGGYREEMSLAEDYDFWLRASASFRLAPLHRDLYLYRSHGRSLTGLRGERVLLATEEALSRNLPRMGWMGDEALAGACLQLAKMALRRKDAAAAGRYVRDAMRHSAGFVARHLSGLLAEFVLGHRRAERLTSLKRRLRRSRSRAAVNAATVQTGD